MPVLLPAELWKRSGRYEIDELFKLDDRKGAPMVLAMTHEEVVTSHVAQFVRSYRDLPLTLYHFQTKERDEPRPRAGVLRTREFIMKDSYTFDRDAEGLQISYDAHIDAYDRIFERCGLEFYRVDSDVGMMGGSGAHEYMAPCAAGENEVALAPGYAANVEVASAVASAVPGLPMAGGLPERVSTPGLTTVAEVAGALGVLPGALLKAFPIVVDGGALTLVLVRGDHRVNEFKLRNFLQADFRQASVEEIEAQIGPAGFIGPVGVSIPVLLDESLSTDHAYIAGANQPDAHLTGVVAGRDFPYTRADIRNVEEGDLVGGQAIRIEAAIEVGNIFKLGTRYSEPFAATYLDEQGEQQLVWMGSYGIGPARIMAAAIEQFADEKGISWPRSLAPFDVEIVAVGKPDTPERAAADAVYAGLQAVGLDVLYDDRDLGPGEKFADAELLGCPLRVTVGRRTLESGELEVQVRRGRIAHEGIALDQAGEAVRQLWQTLP